MKMERSILVILLFSTFSLLTNGFIILPRNVRSQQPTLEQSSSSGDDGFGGSRIEGNSRLPSESELAIMDEMIDKLSSAKPYELPNAVRRAFRVLSSPQFFLRIAERNDAAETDEEKERLSALASNLVSTLDAVVETTEERLQERAKEVETIVKAAAEPDSGEFLVPLLPERIQAMRSALENLDESSLDEGFLSTLDSWMNKSHQDGMDLMIGILQKVMQMYAGAQIGRTLSRDASDNASASNSAKVLERLLQTDADSWDAVLRQSLQEEPDLTASQVLAEIQRTMETIVLSLEAGSMAQRVQAEYLQEMAKRAESFQK